MVQQFKNYYQLSAFAADKILHVVQRKPAAVLCLAGGDTPALTYDLLVQKAIGTAVNFDGVTFIGLDEWVGISGDMPGSCYNFLQQKIFTPLHIRPQQVYFFDSMAADLQNECERINIAVENAGGLDLALVGIGLNGHIGFNEPGVDPLLQAHVVDLDAVTTSTGQKYFKNGALLTKGITLGMAQILAAREILLVAGGSKKAAIMRSALHEPVSNEVPASLLTSHDNALILLDEEAAAAL